MLKVYLYANAAFQKIYYSIKHKTFIFLQIIDNQIHFVKLFTANFTHDNLAICNNLQ